ncbi:MAG: hypothetical protein AAFV53_43705, partial [Myxococcota bacterium]
EPPVVAEASAEPPTETTPEEPEAVEPPAEVVADNSPSAPSAVAAPTPTPPAPRPVRRAGQIESEQTNRRPPPRAGQQTRAPETEPTPVALATDTTPVEPVDIDLDLYSRMAERGELGRSEMMALEAVPLNDGSFTRSRALLLMNAQRKNDAPATKRYLDQLMRKPENQYNPIYQADLARYHANNGAYLIALEHAQMAERHWARLPSDLIFLKKAEIFEIQAAAYQGLFNGSGDDLILLDKSIRHWEKYRDHVNRRSRSDLARRADEELTKLNDVRQRLEY